MEAPLSHALSFWNRIGFKQLRREKKQQIETKQLTTNWIYVRAFYYDGHISLDSTSTLIPTIIQKLHAARHEVFTNILVWIKQTFH